MSIRTAVPADLPELQRIFRSASLSNSVDAALLLAHPEVLEFAGEGVTAGRTRAAVASLGGVQAILGFATVTGAEHGEAELEDLFVDPRWHRRGVARRLIEDAVARVRESGGQRVSVTGGPHAAGFYAAAGFVGSEWVATELGLPGLRLHLSVS